MTAVFTNVNGPAVNTPQVYRIYTHKQKFYIHVRELHANYMHMNGCVLHPIRLEVLCVCVLGTRCV